MALGQETLVPQIRALIGDMLAELGSPSGEYKFDDYLDAADSSPVIGPALEVISLMSLLYLGDYTHPDQVAQDFIRRNFEQMNGSILLSLEELVGSSFALGPGVAQWGIEPRDGDWCLIDLQILDPRTYIFKGSKGQISSVTYTGGANPVDIPYGGEEGRIVHIVSGRSLNFRNPWGRPALRRVMPAYRAWKILMSEMLIAGQRQATPIVVAYSDTAVEVPLLDATGQPLLDANGDEVTIRAPKALADQIENLDNHSYISTDLKNRIEALHAEVGGSFFFEGLKLLQQLQLLGLLMPESILTSTGVGDSNLNTGQRSTLGLIITSLVSQAKEKILDGPIRWLLTWNQGDQETFGDFVPPDDLKIDPLDLFNALNGAVSSGWFSAQDLAVLNRGRQIVGLPEAEATGVSLSRLIGGDRDYFGLGSNGSANSLAN